MSKSIKHLFDDAGLTHIYLTNGFVMYEDPGCRIPCF
jgi:hypothetical protein